MFGNKEEVTIDILSPEPKEEVKPVEQEQVLDKKEQRRADRKADRQLKKGE